jgi:hypothetical protein
MAHFLAATDMGLALSAVWWFFAVAWRCDGRRPRPAALIPASAPR